MLIVDSIHRYPLTGGSGESLDEELIKATGVLGDRELLLYRTGEEGVNKRVSQKQHPKLAVVKTKLIPNSHWQISEPDGGYVDVPLCAGTEESVSVNEFGEMTDAWDAGRDAAEFFSDYIGESVRLAQKTSSWLNELDTSSRRVAPLHIISLATVRFFGVTAERFRPNITLDSDGEAFEEYSWIGKRLCLGDVFIDIIRHTARCNVPGIDQSTGMNKKDVPKMYNNVPRAEVDGVSKPVIGVYGTVVHERVLDTGAKGGIWET